MGGEGAEGYNVNVAWNRSSMGDAEYLAAFYHLLLPIAYEVCTCSFASSQRNETSVLLDVCLRSRAVQQTSRIFDPTNHRS